MFIRCSSCHGVVWMPAASGRGSTEERACLACGEKYRFEIVKRFNDARDELARSARQFGLEQQIDLPSAYSVLLGVMTLDQVADLGIGAPFSATVASVPADRPAGDRPPGRTDAPSSTGGEIEYDPAFSAAVAAGHLTPRQAHERGQRAALVQRLISRHDISQEQAEQVADSRVSLLAAVRQRQRRPDARKEHTVRMPARRGPHPLLVAAFAISATVFVGTHVARLWVDEIKRAHRLDMARAGADVAAQAVESRAADVAVLSPVDAPPAGTSVTTDATSVPLGIEGPTPKSVLLAYCGAGENGRFLEPVALASPVSTQHGLKYGIVRDWRETERTHAIQIRQDRKTRRWIAGDSLNPIPRLDPDRLRLAESRVRIYDAQRM